MKKVSTKDFMTQTGLVVKKINVEKGMNRDIRTFEFDHDADLIR